MIGKAAAAFVVGAIIVAAAPSLWETSFSPNRCDDRHVVATLSELANQKIRPTTADVMLRRGGSADDLAAIKKQMIHNWQEPLNLAFADFRERGSGQCAALAYVVLNGRRTFELQVDYAIERTTSGKTMVTARFAPN